MTFKIDKGVPLPETYQRGKYPFREMGVGDSFFVAAAKRSQITSTVSYAGRRQGKRFITRAVIENGVKGTRVWRIE